MERGSKILGSNIVYPILRTGKGNKNKEQYFSFHTIITFFTFIINGIFYTISPHIMFQSQ
jgi:hypothetical protein